MSVIASPSLRLEPRRSYRLAALLLVAHGGALALLTLTPVMIGAKWVLGAGLLASLNVTLNTHALLRAKQALVALWWDADGQWTLREVGGREFAARLVPGSYVTASLIILTFDAVAEDAQGRLAAVFKRWRHRSLVLMPDSLEAAQLRQLRVRLRYSITSDPE